MQHIKRNHRLKIVPLTEEAWKEDIFSQQTINPRHTTKCVQTPQTKAWSVQCLGTVTQLMWVQQRKLGFNYFDMQAFVHLLHSLLSLLKREEILGTLGTSHCSKRGTKRCYIPNVLWESLDEDMTSLKYFFSSCSGPDFFHPWTDESEEWREKGWDYFWRLPKLLLGFFFSVQCVECDCAMISGNCANPCICALGTSGIATATTSGSSQVEISHIWEPQTSAELPLNSSGQNSCAVGESISRKIRHMVGFPLTSRACWPKS